MKLLICDKDGTLVRPKSGGTFVQHPEDQELIQGVAETIARYVAEGWTIVIASNQGGVSAGYKTLDEAAKEMQFCMKELTPEVDMGMFCPDNGDTIYHLATSASKDGRIVWYPRSENYWDIEGMSMFRKPDPGMIEFAKYYFESGAYSFPAAKYGRNVVVTEILFVGDRPEDQQAAQAAGVNFMWASEWVESLL